MGMGMGRGRGIVCGGGKGERLGCVVGAVKGRGERGREGKGGRMGRGVGRVRRRCWEGWRWTEEQRGVVVVRLSVCAVCSLASRGRSGAERIRVGWSID